MIEHDWEPKIWWKIPKNWRILDSKDSRCLDVWGDRSKQGVLSLLSGLHGTAESSVLFRFLVMGVHYSIIIVRDAPNCWIIGAFQICLSFYFQCPLFLSSGLYQTAESSVLFRWPKTFPKIFTLSIYIFNHVKKCTMSWCWSMEVSGVRSNKH